MTTDHQQTNASVRYQFVRSTYDNRGELSEQSFPVRDTWEEAAADAIEDGSAVWVKNNEFLISHGRIERVKK